MSQKPRFQFSVAAMLVVTTIVAVVAAGVAALDIPFSNPVVRSFLGSYVIFIGSYIAIRGRAMVRNVRDLRQRRRALDETYAAIAEELRRAKSGKAQVNHDANANRGKAGSENS